MGNLMATVTAKDENWNKFRLFCKTVMSHRREIEMAMEAARKRMSATTTRGMNSAAIRQPSAEDGGRPTILKWLRKGCE